MPVLNLTKSDIPFWVGGRGSLKLQVNVPDLNQPLHPTSSDLFDFSFEAGVSPFLTIGAPDTVKLEINSHSNLSLIALWPSSSIDRLDLLKPYEFKSYFEDLNHRDQLLLVFQMAGDLQLGLRSRFQYSVLSADATLQGGADARYTLIRSYPALFSTACILTDFFKALRLPANVRTPLSPDEFMELEYGGYLSFTAKLGTGYQIHGTPSIEINQLRLAERLGFKMMGAIRLGARVAGQFRIEIRPGTENGWARVIVRKSRSRSLTVAADATASVTFENKNWEESASDFLGDVIGLNARNWLNLFGQISDLTDFHRLENDLDNLAKSFIEQFTGKAFAALADASQFDEVMNKIGHVVEAYRRLGEQAVILFDRYFDPATGVVDRRLEEALQAIQNATSWEGLRPKTDEILWDIIQQLTDGDILGWMAGSIELDGQEVESLTEIKRRATKTIDLLNNPSYQGIRDLIGLAKSHFRLDSLLQELSRIDWHALRVMADRRLTGFVERLIGQSLEKLSDSELAKAMERFHQSLMSVDQFKNTLYGKLKATLDQTFEFHLHAEYSRVSEREALIEFEVNLATDKGKELMKRAGHGDFADVLTAYETGEVLLHQGLLTHIITKQSRFAVNVIGWRAGWHYQGLDRLIIEAEQRLRAEPGGQLTVITSLALQKERERKRNGERIYVNFLLRFIGESRGKLVFDQANQDYLIDVITRMEARYRLVFEDPDTTPKELLQYLSFAKEFGLIGPAQTAEAVLLPLLPLDAEGKFGKVSLSYEVRFREEGLRALFARTFTPADALSLRRLVRFIVLTNYVRKGPYLARLGWCYWTSGIHSLWSDERINFAAHSRREFMPITASPFPNLNSPSSITLTRDGLEQLDALYRIEESLVTGFQKLSDILQAPGRMRPLEFEKALADFGSALAVYDDFDEGENTIFALLDRLIHQAIGNLPFRNSSLTLTSSVNHNKFTKMLFA